MEAVADPTWVVHNSNRILNVQIILYCITCCIWLVQSILATYVAYIDMSVVYSNNKLIRKKVFKYLGDPPPISSHLM